MKTIEYRSLKASDRQFLILMLDWASSSDQTDNAPLLPLHILEDFPDKAGDFSLGAFDQNSGEFIGAILIRYWSDEEHCPGFISEDIPELVMAVSPDYRGLGFGRELLDRVLARQLEQSVIGTEPTASISLHVDRSNTAASELYRTAGFKPLREKPLDSSGTVLRWDAPVKLDTMSSDDIPSALNLWRESDGVWLNEEREDSPVGIRSFLDHNPGLSFVLRLPGRSELAGAVMGSSDGRRGYVHHLAVHRAFRHRGLAKSLLDAVRRELVERHIEKMHLFTFNSNQMAIDFYRHIGWQFRDDLSMFSLLTGKPETER